MARTGTTPLQAERVERRRAGNVGGVGGRGGLGGLARRLRGLTGTTDEPRLAQPVGESPGDEAAGNPPAAEAAAPPTSIPPPERALPASVLDAARADTHALLATIDEVRPGLVRRRALDLDCRAGARVQALCESFDECDGVSSSFEVVQIAMKLNRHGDRCRYIHAGAEQQLPFTDESFDLVHCGKLVAAHTAHVIPETLRVLRLFGVAVAEVADPEHGRDPRSLDDSLPITLTAPERFSAPGKLPLIVTNTGSSALGSVIAPLQIEARWIGFGDDAPDRCPQVIELAGSVLPGDSLIMRLPMLSAPAHDAHALELTAFAPDSWSERRSNPVSVATGADPIGELVTRAGGVVLRAERLAPAPGGATGRRYLLARA
jgi:hypothetical protein